MAELLFISSLIVSMHAWEHRTSTNKCRSYDSWFVFLLTKNRNVDGERKKRVEFRSHGVSPAELLIKFTHSEITFVIGSLAKRKAYEYEHILHQSMLQPRFVRKVCLVVNELRERRRNHIDAWRDKSRLKIATWNFQLQCANREDNGLFSWLEGRDICSGITKQLVLPQSWYRSSPAKQMISNTLADTNYSTRERQREIPISNKSASLCLLASESHPTGQ